jgi:hypothetical protein
MFSRISQTLILIAMIAIGVRLWQPPRLAAESGARAEPDALLLQRVHRLDVRGLSREQAVAMIQKECSAKLIVDWRSLTGIVATEEEEAQYRSAKLDAWVGDVTIETALKGVLGKTASFQVAGSNIKVTANEELNAEEMTVRAYDIADLVTDKFWGVTTPPGEEMAVRAARANQVRNVITQHTYAIGWHINYIGSGNPGGNASISVLGTSLLVTQTTDGHWTVAHALWELRHPSGGGQ